MSVGKRYDLIPFSVVVGKKEPRGWGLAGILGQKGYVGDTKLAQVDDHPPPSLADIWRRHS